MLYINCQSIQPSRVARHFNEITFTGIRNPTFFIKTFQYCKKILSSESETKKLFSSLPHIPADIETLRVYIIAPVCFHFAAQYRYDCNETLLAYSRRFLAIKGKRTFYYTVNSANLKLQILN